jgi:response regulator RpfG family c-di-GMP phosphodiesterase
VRLPAAARRPGTYTLVTTARPVDGGSRPVVSRRTLRIMRGAGGPRESLDVVLLRAPMVQRTVSQGLSTTVTVYSVERVSDVYDVSSRQRANVQIMVLDLEAAGSNPAALVRNLHAVFPQARIVALAHRTSLVDVARRAGASVVLTEPVSRNLLTNVVRTLLKQRDLRLTAKR